MSQYDIKLKIETQNDCLSDLDVHDWLNTDFKRLENIDVNGRNKDGITPLHMAACYIPRKEKAEEWVEKLVERGANVNARSKHGYTPLHLSAEFTVDLVKVAEILILKGGYVNARDIEGNTALHFATIRNSQKTVILLLEHKANVLMENKDGKTAMELGEENKDFRFSDAYWMLHDATYNQKDNPKNE